MEEEDTTTAIKIPWMTKEELLRQFLEKNYVVMALYVPVFISALVANILVIFVVIKDHYMRSVTNYFLVNLSVADLMVTVVCMPNGARRAYTAIYPFGYHTCKISAYLQCVSVASSIFTITAMAIDRYLAIAKPFGLAYRCFSKKTTIIVITVLWLTSLILFFPILEVTSLKRHDFHLGNMNVSVELCIQEWTDYFISRRALGIVWFICMFAMPGLILLLTYSLMGHKLCSVLPPFDKNEGYSSTQQRNRLVRERRRVASILVLLAILFAACWLPYHIVILLFDIDNGEDKMLKELEPYLLLLGHANSAVNPIIYTALSKKFRRSLKGLFKISFTFKRRGRPMQWVDSSGSGTQLNYLHRLKSAPTVHKQLHLNMSRLQSSQKTTKTTKTCAV